MTTSSARGKLLLNALTCRWWDTDRSAPTAASVSSPTEAPPYGLLVNLGMVRPS
jgi:hypothetical protein